MWFYDNFGSENKATNGIENWSLSTIPLLIDASSRENHSEYQQTLYHQKLVSSEHFCHWQYWRIFIHFQTQK